MKLDVTIICDTKQWDRMEKRLLRGSGKAVDVGWWQSLHNSGFPTAQIAAWNEEGHMNGGMFAGTITPPRPFIRTGFIPSLVKTFPIYFKDIHNIAIGTSTWDRLNKKIGEDMVKLLQKTIWNWNSPSNSPVTISLKGFNNPLIDSGNMYDSIKYRIVRSAK